MGLRNSNQQWGGIAKSFHWLLAVLILAMFVLGWTAESYPMSPTKLKLFGLHKSTGLVILALVVLRIAWRAFDPAPALPADTSALERILAHATHRLLYVLMVAMPLSGWVINSAADFPLKIYGWIRVPHIAPASESLQTSAEVVHLTLFWIMALLVGIHVAAALWHHFERRDTILRRMLPFTRLH